MPARLRKKTDARRLASPALGRGERGATLLETITVISIVGVISYAAVVSFSSGSADIQAQAAAKLLMQDLRLAQQYAVSTSRGTKVIIDVQNNHYSLKWLDNDGYITRPMGGGNYIVRFGEEDFPDVSLISTGLVNGTLVFDARGRPCNGQQPLLSQADVAALPGGLLIRITPNTGKLLLVQ